MDNHFGSTGFQKFGHLEDKIKRTTILCDELENELALFRGAHDELTNRRNSLMRETTILEHKCTLLEDSNAVTFAKASEILSRLDDFIELFSENRAIARKAS